MPLRVAIPNSDINPIIAGILITPSVKKIVNTPPISANGRFNRMTADWVNLPYEFLQKTSNKIINNVKGVNRVVYDISSKPPATIEWE